jgi:hypothetical protein
VRGIVVSKADLGIAMGWFARLLGLLRTIDRLMSLEREQATALEALKERVARLEAREPVLIAEAKAVSATAASAAATQHVGDLARRLGVLEEQVRQMIQGSPRKRLTDR